jgi:hypothetical protein
MAHGGDAFVATIPVFGLIPLGASNPRELPSPHDVDRNSVERSFAPE